MTQIITQEQLDLFNQNFEIKMMREDTDYTEHEKLKPEHFDLDLIEDHRLWENSPIFSEEKYEICFISNKQGTFGNQIRNISTAQDIKDFILNEMEDILNQQSNSSREQDFQKKLELFNQNFTLDLVQTKEYYHDSVELTFEDLESSTPIQDTINFDKPEDAHLEILESYHAINQGSELIQTVKTMAQVKYFIENDMDEYL